MKKYVQFKCSVCKRERDELTDVGHYSPDKCTITLGCEGRLSIVGYTNDNSGTNNIAPSGLTNWYPRGENVSITNNISNDLLYSTSTGIKQQLVIAVKNTNPNYSPIDSDKLIVNFSVQEQSAKDYRQYTYRKAGSVQSINGTEDGLSKKVLRYSSSDEVQVYVNGIKRTNGVDYFLFGNNPGAAPNSIYFEPALVGSSTQVDVIVTRTAVLNTAQIILSKSIYDESRISTGAWEGVDVVISGNDVWHLFYADISELVNFPVNVKLKLADAQIVDNAVTHQITDPNLITQSFAPQQNYSACILLSRENVYTHIDKLKAVNVPVFNLKDDGYLIMKIEESKRVLYITENSIAQVFPPFSSKSFGDHKFPLLKSGNINSSASEIDSTLIIGPDA